MRESRLDPASGRNYSLVPWSPQEVLRQVYVSLNDAYHYFIVHSIEKARLRRYLKRGTQLTCVSVGSGRQVPENWIGIDRRRGKHVYRLDLRRSLPFETESVDAILSEHMLEHFHLDDIEYMLSEWLRVLRPGGRVRIACPDARTVGMILLGFESEKVDQQRALEERIHKWEPSDPLFDCRMANRLSHQFGEHVALLTPEWVAEMLMAAGFSGIQEVDASTSKYFNVVPTTHFVKFPNTEFEVFCLEAIKQPDAGGAI